MAQHIGIIKINEKSEELEASNINFAEISNLLEESNDYQLKYPWLASIDPYGDTIFNTKQLPNVIDEIKKVSGESNVSEDTLNTLINFLSNVNTHEYIKFIGD